jgi:hypothetical protein
MENHAPLFFVLTVKKHRYLLYIFIHYAFSVYIATVGVAMYFLRSFRLAMIFAVFFIPWECKKNGGGGGGWPGVAI